MPKSYIPIIALLGSLNASEEVATKHLTHRNKLQVLDTMYASYSEMTGDYEYHAEYTF